MLRRTLVTLLMSLFCVSTTYAQNDEIESDTNEEELIEYLKINFYPSAPKNYNLARDAMYSYLDVDATDSLTCAYTGLRAKADGTRTPSNMGLSFNTEHSWPQSFYEEKEPMRGDVHHLYPVWSSPNSSRSNHPYANIEDSDATSWWFWENGSSVSSVPTSKKEQYSKYYKSTFEPRDDHKGNVARAMFYFWTIYQDNEFIVNSTRDNESFFDGMKETLYEWHKLDPVDESEISRSLEIENLQGNKNPFIHDTTLIRRAYFYEEPVSTVSREDDNFVNEHFTLNQNYPNPFNPTTQITYSLRESSAINLVVLNSIGQLVSTLEDEIKPSGSHSVTFNADNLPSGIYYYQLRANGLVQTNKMMLIK